MPIGRRDFDKLEYNNKIALQFVCEYAKINKSN